MTVAEIHLLSSNCTHVFMPSNLISKFELATCHVRVPAVPPPPPKLLLLLRWTICNPALDYGLKPPRNEYLYT